MLGNVTLNGKNRKINCRDVSYVTQRDAFLGSLTVKEILCFSAHLRLPTTMTKHEMDEAIEDTIAKMGLQDCANNKIGNWHLRGISRGEKRRLSIGLDILTQPRILFLDEPTSGLDSASSFFVIQAIRNIAHEGKMVICSIHQPSTDVFKLFDDLFLLSSGEAVYFGEAKMAVKFFADAGFPCATKRNPPDHFLRCINPDFDRILATLKRTQRDYGISPTSSDYSSTMTATEIRSIFVQKYKSSTNAENTRIRIQEIILSIEEHVSELNKSYPSWWRQLPTLIHRSLLNMSRDLGYFWIRILFYLMVSIGAATLDFNIGTSNSAILARAKCHGFLYGLMSCLSVGSLPFVTEEIKVSNGERLSGHYGEGVYVISNFLSAFPFVVAISFSSGPILYYMVKLHPGISHLYFCINLFCYIAVSEASILVVATLVSNPFIALAAATGATVLNLMPSDAFRRLPDLPKIFWRYPMSYISYASWGIQGLLKNDMSGLEFDPLMPEDPKLSGDIILKTIYGINPDHSKWWDVAALFCLLILYRLLFCLALKYRERASSGLHRFYAKTFLQHTIPR